MYSKTAQQNTVASTASLACLHVLFFVFFGLTCSWTCLRRCGFSGKDVGMVFSIASSNILTWTIGYFKLSSGNFTVFCCAVLEYILYWKTRTIFAGYCYGSFFFFFLCMSPDETLEQDRNASRQLFAQLCGEYGQYYSISDCVVWFLRTYHNRLY